ncbi:MAG: helix-turn-helix domain-containing protein [Rhodospirillales bacterium]|jgi:hypothetical protein
MSLVSVSDYARQTGLTKQAISKALDRLVGLGMVATERRNGRLLFNPLAFEAARSRVADPARTLVSQARSMPVTPPSSLPVSPNMPTSLFDGFDPSGLPPEQSAVKNEAGEGAGHIEQYNRGRASSIALDVYAKAMRFASDAGQLVLAEEVEREIAQALGELRDALLSRPAELAGRLAGLNEREMTIALRELFRSLLEQLARRMDKESSSDEQNSVAERGVEEAG